MSGQSSGQHKNFFLSVKHDESDDLKDPKNESDYLHGLQESEDESDPEIHDEQEQLIDESHGPHGLHGFLHGLQESLDEDDLHGLQDESEDLDIHDEQEQLINESHGSHGSHGFLHGLQESEDESLDDLNGLHGLCGL